MGYIELSGITGLVTPATGNTDIAGFDVMYNDAKIVSYFKKNIVASGNNAFTAQFIVSVIFETYTQLFIFHDDASRNTFYDSLPTS